MAVVHVARFQESVDISGLRDRLRSTVARGSPWMLVRRGLECLDTSQSEIGIWHRMREFITLARQSPHPPRRMAWIDGIIESMGPPTLEQIVAGAQVMRKVS
jgi:hypothetical protein